MLLLYFSSFAPASVLASRARVCVFFFSDSSSIDWYTESAEKRAHRERDLCKKEDEEEDAAQQAGEAAIAEAQRLVVRSATLI
jgi:hypothetical protein